GVRNRSVARIGHGWIEPSTVYADPPPDGLEKVRVAVFAYARVNVSCNVGRVERAKRQCERSAAGKGRSAHRCVAGRAISSTREILAACNKAGTGKCRRNASRIKPLIIGER